MPLDALIREWRVMWSHCKYMRIRSVLVQCLYTCPMLASGSWPLWLDGSDIRSRKDALAKKWRFVDNTERITCIHSMTCLHRMPNDWAHSGYRPSLFWMTLLWNYLKPCLVSRLLKLVDICTVFWDALFNCTIYTCYVMKKSSLLWNISVALLICNTWFHFELESQIEILQFK